MSSLSLRSRLIVFALVGATVAGLVGATGLLGLQRSAAKTQLLEESTIAVRASMNADMKHDSMRAEIMRAAVAAQGGDAAVMADAEKEVAGHGKALLDSLARAAEKAPDATAAQALAVVLPAARRFTDLALATAAQIRKQPDQAARALADFEPAFQQLVPLMDASGQAIEAAAEAIAQQARDDARRVQAAMLAVLLVGLAAFAGFSAWEVRGILQPLLGLRGAVQQLNRDDGDLSRRLPPAAVPEFAEVAVLFNRFLDKIARVVGDVQKAAGEISHASTQIAAGNQDLSQRTEQTAAGLQQAAASVEQITASVRQSAGVAGQANELAALASQVAGRGGEAVARVVSTMAEIDTASHRIGEIIGVIDGIAFQTNILALNAAVEAARAGEQGRGFAVVAAEVRALAQRSAAAAREIKALIATSVEKVEAGDQYVKQAGATMGEILAGVQRVGTLIGEISAAAKEQSSGIVAVNEAVSGLDRSTQQNAALVEQTAAAASEMARQATLLAGTVSVFKTCASA